MTTSTESFTDLVDRVVRTRRRIAIEKDGVAIAAILPAADVDRRDRFDTEWGEDFAVLDEIGAAFADVPVEELERELAKALAEVRAEMQVEHAAGISR